MLLIHDIFDYLCFLQSLITLGAMFGSIIGGWAIDYFGRKSTIMMCSLPFELGWFLIAFAKNHEMLYAGRVISGVACGMITVGVPVRIINIEVTSSFLKFF